MSSTCILIGNSLVKHVSYGSRAFRQSIEIGFYHRRQTGLVDVRSEYGLIGKNA